MHTIPVFISCWLPSYIRITFNICIMCSHHLALQHQQGQICMHSTPPAPPTIMASWIRCSTILSDRMDVFIRSLNCRFHFSARPHPTVRQEPKLRYVKLRTLKRIQQRFVQIDVCACLCISVYMYLCVHVHMSLCICTCLDHVCAHVHVHLSVVYLSHLCVCMYVFVSMSMYACICCVSVCMSLCMYLCVDVCVCAYPYAAVCVHVSVVYICVE